MMMNKFEKQKNKNEINLNEISSLNVSKSISNIFAEIGAPSVSSLSNRYDENSEDLSLNFSLHRSESNR